MIKEFCLLFSSLGCLSVPSIQNDRQYQHIENVGNTEVTYKYETNEVNSVSDLVVGHMYHLDELSSSKFDAVTDVYNIGLHLYNFEVSLYTPDVYIDEITDEDIHYDYVFTDIILYDTGDVYLNYVYLVFGDNIVSIGDLSNNFVFSNIDFMFDDNISIQYLNEFYFEYNGVLPSASSYNVIESVTYTPPSTVVGVINEFCEDYLFSEIPYVNEISFTVGGQQISLMTYLVIFVGISLGVLILILMFYLFKWLFFLFANIFKPR